MKVDRSTAAITFLGEDGETLRVCYDNRGEPYREGVSLELALSEEQGSVAHVFLEVSEQDRLRDLLLRLSPKSSTALAEQIITSALGVLSAEQLDTPCKAYGYRTLRDAIGRYQQIRKSEAS